MLSKFANVQMHKLCPHSAHTVFNSTGGINLITNNNTVPVLSWINDY